MQRWRRGLVLVLVNVALVALLLEGALRLAADRLPGRLAAAARYAQTGQLYAQDWTPAWQSNPDHTYILKPGLTDVLQYGSPSVSFRLTTIELWAGGGVGFRTRPIDYFVDAVVVGDSFGLCFTEQAACWVEQLPGYFVPPFGIVNLSQPVTGSTSHARILADFGAPLRPPLVIWQFFGNDFNDDYGLSTFGTDPAPADAVTAAPGPGDWLQRHSVAAAVLATALTGALPGLDGSARLFEEAYSVPVGGEVLRFGAPYEQQALDMALPRNQAGLALSRQALRAAREQVNAWGGRLAVVIIPTREEVYAPLTEPIMGAAALDKLRSARAAMQGLCVELALPCYDALAALQAHPDELLYYSDDMHLNPRGNSVLAAALAGWLVEQGLIAPERRAGD
ncbi:MAG: hypothetical protein MUE40_19655 [Anaerolineae bacterium]|nr:hypothetical protein [Anaerolineae bacterium]